MSQAPGQWYRVLHDRVSQAPGQWYRVSQAPGQWYRVPGLSPILLLSLTLRKLLYKSVVASFYIVHDSLVLGPIEL